jgi:hypothetical protein
VLRESAAPARPLPGRLRSARRSLAHNRCLVARNRCDTVVGDVEKIISDQTPDAQSGGVAARHRLVGDDHGAVGASAGWAHARGAPPAAPASRLSEPAACSGCSAAHAAGRRLSRPDASGHRAGQWRIWRGVLRAQWSAPVCADQVGARTKQRGSARAASLQPCARPSLGKACVPLIDGRFRPAG